MKGDEKIKILLLDQLGLADKINAELTRYNMDREIKIVEDRDTLLDLSSEGEDCIIVSSENIEVKMLRNLISRFKSLPVILIARNLNSVKKNQIYKDGLFAVISESMLNDGALPWYIQFSLEKDTHIKDLLISEEKYKRYFHQLKSGEIKSIYTPDIETGYLHVQPKKSLNIDEQMMVHLKKAAHYDYLTQIPNRKYFEDNLQKQISRSQRLKEIFYLCIVDIDHFKSINDIHGHDIGDELLKEVSRKLRSLLRSMDFFARLGGDEFAVVLMDPSSISGAVEVTKRLLSELTGTYMLLGCKLHIGVSIGVADYNPHENMTFNELMKKADLALYSAKAKGRNQFQFFESEIGELHQKFHSIENALHHAIKKNEFSIMYQPIMDVDTHEIVSFEALLRWDSDILNARILPADFVPIAEESGRIIRITNHVFDLVLKDIKKYMDKGIQLPPVSINCSGLDLMSDGFVTRLKHLMKKYKVNPEQIHVELTETTVMEAYDVIGKTIDDLRSEKISISIDDFGTGYSSLARLREVNFDFIKIDRAFIVNMLSDTSAMQIVRAVIELAKQLGIAAIAEGVEREEEIDFLKSWGCSFAQGFFLSKPLLFEEVGPFLLQRNGSYGSENEGLSGSIFHCANTLKRVAHDMNNQLAGILGYTEILLQKIRVLTDDYNIVRSIHSAILEAINTITRLSVDVESMQKQLGYDDVEDRNILVELDQIAKKSSNQIARAVIQVEYSILPVLNYKEGELEPSVVVKFQRIQELLMSVKSLNEKLPHFNIYKGSKHKDHD